MISETLAPLFFFALTIYVKVFLFLAVLVIPPLTVYCVVLVISQSGGGVAGSSGD